MLQTVSPRVLCALSVAVVLALVGCANADTGPVEVVTADPDGMALDLVVAACNPPGLRVDVEESDSSVTLRATVEWHAAGDDCASLRQVGLRAPLGDRQVVDALTGDAVSPTGGQVALRELRSSGGSRRDRPCLEPARADDGTRQVADGTDRDALACHFHGR